MRVRPSWGIVSVIFDETYAWFDRCVTGIGVMGRLPVVGTSRLVTACGGIGVWL